MASYAFIVIVSIVSCVSAYPSSHSAYTFPFISKSEWGGSPARAVSPLNNPVAFVVIHHTYIPRVCMTRDACMRAMRSMQNTHMNSNGWTDIGYNFAVGGEGAAYEGRGWEVVGAHAIGYNTNSVGIALIGDWVSNLPHAKQLETTKALIKAGVRLGYISPNYKLIGHRQVSATECPGSRLFEEISTWDNFTTL